MTPPELEALANLWIDAFSTHDVAALLSLYALDAVHVSPKLRAAQPETGGLLRGHAALAAWWSAAFAKSPSLRYKATRLTPGSSHIFLEYTRTVLGEPATDVAELLETNGLLIVRSRVFHG